MCKFKEVIENMNSLEILSDLEKPQENKRKKQNLNKFTF